VDKTLLYQWFEEWINPAAELNLGRQKGCVACVQKIRNFLFSSGTQFFCGQMYFLIPGIAQLLP